MDEELNYLFGQVAAINLSEEVKEPKRGENPTMGVKDTLKTGFAIIGLIVVGAWSLNEGIAKALHTPAPMANVSSDEEHVISRIDKFCHNPVKALNDQEACEDAWRKYRQLGKYNADGPVTNTQLSQANQDFANKGIQTQHDRWEREATQGNVQGPVKH